MKIGSLVHALDHTGACARGLVTVWRESGAIDLVSFPALQEEHLASRYNFGVEIDHDPAANPIEDERVISWHNPGALPTCIISTSLTLSIGSRDGNERRRRAVWIAIPERSGSPPTVGSPSTGGARP